MKKVHPASAAGRWGPEILKKLEPREGIYS